MVWLFGWFVCGDWVGLELGLDGCLLVVFNFMILMLLIGMLWLFDLIDYVLIVEEVLELMYNVDWMLFKFVYVM